MLTRLKHLRRPYWHLSQVACVALLVISVWVQTTPHDHAIGDQSASASCLLCLGNSAAPAAADTTALSFPPVPATAFVSKTYEAYCATAPTPTSRGPPTTT